MKQIYVGICVIVTFSILLISCTVKFGMFDRYYSKYEKFNTQTGSVTLEKGGVAMDVSGDYVYVVVDDTISGSGGRLLVVNASTVTNPFIEGSKDISSDVKDVVIYNQYCLVTYNISGNSYIGIIDVSNASSPNYIGPIDLSNDNLITSLELYNNYLICHAAGGIINFIDLKSDIINSTELTASYIDYDPMSVENNNINGIEIVNDRLYVVVNNTQSFTTTMNNYDLTSLPGAWSGTTSLDLGSVTFSDIFYDQLNTGNYAYLTTSMEIRTINIQNDANPDLQDLILRDPDTSFNLLYTNMAAYDGYAYSLYYNKFYYFPLNTFTGFYIEGVENNGFPSDGSSMMDLEIINDFLYVIKGDLLGIYKL